MSREPLPHEPGPHWGEVGIHGLHRPREWDAVVLVDVPPLAGDRVEFAALPDGTLVSSDDRDVSPFARKLGLPPPYRAEAVRRDMESWSVGARTIRVVELAAPATGDEIEIVWDASGRRVEIDGDPTLVSFPELERLAGDFDAWVLWARRLRGTAWEVEIRPL
jgi:hypothetical protein